MTGLDQLLGFDPASCQDSTFRMTVLGSVGCDLWVTFFLVPNPGSVTPHHCLAPQLWASTMTGSLYWILETAGLAILTRYFKGYLYLGFKQKIIFHLRKQKEAKKNHSVLEYKVYVLLKFLPVVKSVNQGKGGT